MADCGSRAKAKKLRQAIEEHAIHISYPEDPEQDYEVEEILSHDEPIPGQLMFRIKWKGYDESWNSWEPVNLLDNCPDKLREYKLRVGLPLTSADATIKLTPVKSQPPVTSDKKGSRIETRGRKKKQNGAKRKLLDDLPPAPPAKRTHISVTPDPRPASTSRSLVRSSTSGGVAAVTASVPKAEVLEVMNDGTGKFMVSIQLPGRTQPALMWYQEIKERYPCLVIDFFERHLKFRKSGGQNFVLVPPE